MKGTLRLGALLLVLALLLCGCGPTGDPATAMVQPIRFYYRTARTEFDTEDGVIRAELRDLGQRSYGDLELFQLYFQGPQSRDLVSPITQDTELAGVSRSGGTLELDLVRDANSPAEFDHALTYACLAKTGLELEGVRQVRILVKSRGGTTQADVLLSERDLLLYDSGVSPASREFNLYYTDEAGRFLLTEKRALPYQDTETLALRVLELLDQPQSQGLRSPLPLGTAVLDLSVENGLCTVDFNGDFYTNRPQTEQGEALTLLSVVNTLCELDGISQVQIYVEGRRPQPYLWLELSAPWSMDSAVVGPVREELNEFAGTLCLPGLQDSLLHRLEIRCRAGSGVSRAQALLTALLGRGSQNGLSNPLAGAVVEEVNVDKGLCTLSLRAGSLPTEELPRQTALRALTATLCSLPEISAVAVIEAGDPAPREPLVPSKTWFAAQPEESPEQ